jgi:hypothetical protein
MRENILPELSNFYCRPGKAGGSPRAFRLARIGEVASALRKSDPVVLGRSDPGQEQHWER